jgi:hypothetical protein
MFVNVSRQGIKFYIFPLQQLSESDISATVDSPTFSRVNPNSTN